MINHDGFEPCRADQAVYNLTKSTDASNDDGPFIIDLVMRDVLDCATKTLADHFHKDEQKWCDQHRECDDQQNAFRNADWDDILRDGKCG